MTEGNTRDDHALLLKELEADLLHLYGPLLSGQDLRKVLGYPSLEAMRQAVLRDSIPIRIFAIKHRRGKFALAKDVAHWLVEQRNREESELKLENRFNDKGEKDDLT